MIGQLSNTLCICRALCGDRWVDQAHRRGAQVQPSRPCPVAACPASPPQHCVILPRLPPAQASQQANHRRLNNILSGHTLQRKGFGLVGQGRSAQRRQAAGVLAQRGSTFSAAAWLPPASQPSSRRRACEVTLAWKRRVRRLRRKSSATWVPQGAPQRCSPCAAPLPPAAAAVMLPLEGLPSRCSTASRHGWQGLLVKLGMHGEGFLPLKT